ncbi:sulfite exporter TauE/SafE family protein [Pacificibacter marinus]|uniref:sulfite exporter TauE/SafE family protein n=1 Tax=Pacificibacter marinus TaxID=658057 RepID=UPI001C064D2B|nr:sulfite exporter TauE/SafE family protein [Pacificibacter marinus]MBU2865478.1 sulfite exporter TauE/SafE family protein [Pacificibacter marinus]
MILSTTILVLVAVLFSAFLRGLAGFGFALAAVPIVSLVLSPLEAVTLSILLQVVVGVRDSFTLYGEVHRPSLLRLCIGAIVGIPIGVLALTALSADAARIMIAVVVLAGLIILMRYKPSTAEPNGPLAVVAGGIAGAFTGLAAMPGPPAVAYFLGTSLPPKQTRASLLLFFFVVCILTTPGLYFKGALTQSTLIITALSIPSMALGTWLGTATFKRLNSTQYRNVAIGVMAIAAILAGARGIAAYM